MVILIGMCFGVQKPLLSTAVVLERNADEDLRSVIWKAFEVKGIEYLDVEIDDVIMHHGTSMWQHILKQKLMQKCITGTPPFLTRLRHLLVKSSKQPSSVTHFPNMHTLLSPSQLPKKD
eukprot:11755297-Ditylum_brightwellii.AAC.1